MNTLSEDASAQRAKLAAKQTEVDAAMAEIQEAMEAAGARKTEVEALSKQQAHEQAGVTERKARWLSLRACIAAFSLRSFAQPRTCAGTGEHNCKPPACLQAHMLCMYPRVA